MKKKISLITVIIACVYMGFTWMQFKEKPQTFEDFQRVFTNNSLVLGQNVVLKAEHFTAAYDAALKESVDYVSVFEFFTELNQSIQFLKETNDLMLSLIIESDDTGLLKESYKSNKNNATLTPLISSNSLGDLSKNPRLTEASDMFEQSNVLNQKLFTYLVLATEDKEDSLNEQLAVDLPIRYEEIKKQFSSVLFEFFNTVYPILNETLTPLGFNGGGKLVLSVEDIQNSVVNYIKISNRYYDQLQTYCENVRNYEDLLNVLTKFDTVNAYVNSTEDFSDEEVKHKMDELLISIENTTPVMSHFIEKQADQLLQSDIRIDEVLVEKLVLANQLLNEYLMLTKENQEKWVIRQDETMPETYTILYGLVQSIYTDLLEDPMMSLFSELSQESIEDSKILVKEMQ